MRPLSWIRLLSTIAILLAPAIYFGILGKQKEMLAIVIPSGLAAVFINLEKFQSIKYKGLELQLRKAIDEAYATTESLRKIAKALLLSQMYTLNHGNRIVDSDDSERHRVRDKLEQLGKEISVHDDEDIRNAHTTFFRLHAWDRFGHLVHTFLSVEIGHPNPNVYNALMDLFRRSTLDFPNEEQISAALRNLTEPLAPQQSAARDEYLRYRDKHLSALRVK
jgi:hypothetical protein